MALQITQIERGRGLDVFERLYSENASFIKYYMLNMCGSIHTAEEIVQETFYKTFLYIRRFEHVQINRQWLMKTAYNTFVDHYRKLKNETSAVSFEVLSEINCLSREIGIYTNLYEESIIVNKVISELPVSYRTVILLKDHYGFSTKEIASILGYSESNAKVVLHRARKHFRKEYSKYEG